MAWPDGPDAFARLEFKSKSRIKCWMWKRNRRGYWRCYSTLLRELPLEVYDVRFLGFLLLRVWCF